MFQRREDRLSEHPENLPKIISDPDWEIRSAVFFKEQNVGKSDKLKSLSSDKVESEKLPVIEFKKINPTKYRVRVHNVSGKFPLVFSESFHDGWKAYLAKPSNFQFSISNFQTNSNDLISKYKILDGNEEDQASKDELGDFIQKGWVADLGNGKEKTGEHKKWEDNKEKLDYVEKYNIGFISKNFQGTVQSDNLSSGNIFETWLPASKMNDPKNKSGIFSGAGKVVELTEEDHLMANGYANSWVINTEEICKGRSLDFARDDTYCVKNEDGSYDMELVVEFWPQRLFYLGLGISGVTLLGCLVYLAYDWKKIKKNVILNNE